MFFLATITAFWGYFFASTKYFSFIWFPLSPPSKKPNENKLPGVSLSPDSPAEPPLKPKAFPTAAPVQLLQRCSKHAGTLPIAARDKEGNRIIRKASRVSRNSYSALSARRQVVSNITPRMVCHQTEIIRNHRKIFVELVFLNEQPPKKTPRYMNDIPYFTRYLKHFFCVRNSRQNSKPSLQKHYTTVFFLKYITQNKIIAHNLKSLKFEILLLAFLKARHTISYLTQNQMSKKLKIHKTRPKVINLPTPVT